MTAYPEPFELNFMKRTLEIVSKYDGHLQATMLLNCLLGLLILPRETLIDRIPEDPIDDLEQWGIPRKAITKFGKCPCGNNTPLNLRQLVRCLRNAVAHFKVSPVQHEAQVEGFRFTDRNGFVASITLEQINVFVRELAKHLEQELAAQQPPAPRARSPERRKES